MHDSPRILVVGAGQAGLGLARGLLAHGVEVTVVSAQTPQQMRRQRPRSTQVKFPRALAVDRRWGNDLYDDQAPPITGLRVRVPGPQPLDLVGRGPLADTPARSVDQRLVMPALLEAVERAGGRTRYEQVTDLAALADGYDLVVVTAGRGPLAERFPVDRRWQRYERPQRHLFLAYVDGMRGVADPRLPGPGVTMTMLPGAGELFTIPALSGDDAGTRQVGMLLVEAVPGGPLDRFGDANLGPAEALDTARDVYREFAPADHDRIRTATPADQWSTATGAVLPTVREPVLELPNGVTALAAGDTWVTQDPVAAQGSNTATVTYGALLDAILGRIADGRALDAAWARRFTAQLFAATLAPAARWSLSMIAPPDQVPPHVPALLAAGSRYPQVADRLVAGFDDPATLGWFADSDRAREYLRRVGAEAPVNA